METETVGSFDPNFAAQILLDIAHEQSLDNLLQKFIARAMERPHMACGQVWLIQKGDLCATCPRRADCSDQSRCLHLTVARAKSHLGPGRGFNRLDPRSAREPLGLPPLGSVVVSGKQRAVPDLHQQPPSPLDPDWMREENVHGYAINPITFNGEILGAIVSATREAFQEELRPWGQIFADHLGAAIVNARAFDEIQRLKSQLELQNAYLHEAVVEAKAFGDLIGQSPALRHIVEQIEVVAPTEASVLILGETGTGKELVAHEIHRGSARKDGPLVRVNCASIPRELFESELFGHIRGSFTGAIKDRAGRFETAEGGTIFLDEVGEIPMDSQTKLLRVLQEKRYERVGDDRTRRANVRIVAATNRDLKKAAAAGRFREDLYYRLNVFPIQVPPLRERIDDVPLLAKHFVELSARDLKCAKPRLTRAGVTKLQGYDWPGNVRELRNLIERAVILARGGVVDFDLPISGQPTPPVTAPVRCESFTLSGATLGRSDSPAAAEAQDGIVETPSKPNFLTEAEVERFQRENLLRALEAANWKIKGQDGASELLGLKPTTLLSRMEKWGLRKPERSP